ncbi:MAG: cytochrome b N-terminal domain-containing protein, partial [Bacteroidota bacterium]
VNDETPASAIKDLAFESVQFIESKVNFGWLIRSIHSWSANLMVFSVFVHMFSVYFLKSYKKPRELTWYTGIFLALFWFMPFISVRNLAEFVSVPPVLIAIYLFIKENQKNKDLLLAGIWLGIGISMRFQLVFILIGLAIALVLVKTNFKSLLLILLGFCISAFLGTCLIDIIIWKKPFAEFWSYVDYNIQNVGVYGTDNTWMYLQLILGLLIPPLSFVLIAGYFYTWKKIPLLFWPVFIYLCFHTYFPNKQERFVLTILPLFIISGTVGMFQLHQLYKSKINHKLFKYSKIFVITLNLILLPILTLSYSKRHRVETMYYLYQHHVKQDFWIEDSNKENNWQQPPRFYYGKWYSDFGITKTWTADSALVLYQKLPVNNRPNYLIFFQAENMQSRLDSTLRRFPKLKLEAVIQPSLIDKTLHFLNPLNDNQTSYIYQIDSSLTGH